MIEINGKIYQQLADALKSQLDSKSDFFNGRVEMDTDKFYSNFICTLIIYRKRHQTEGGRMVSETEDIVPVWWEFNATEGGIQVETDFCWNEFKKYLL